MADLQAQLVEQLEVMAERVVLVLTCKDIGEGPAAAVVALAPQLVVMVEHQWVTAAAVVVVAQAKPAGAATVEPVRQD